MALHDLPIEILFLLLQSLDCPGLISLIRASSSCFRAYIQSPQLVLAAVLKNAIEPDALYHALAVFHLPAPKILGASLQQAFLDDYFQPNIASFAFPADKPALIDLWRLHARVSYFVDDYSSRAMRTFVTELDSGQVLTISPLSRSERARFQRAFYRHELYSRIFPPKRTAPYGSLVPARGQFTQFLARMEPWEAEEMTCVHHYFTTLMGGFLDDLEDLVVDAVLAAPGVSCPPDLVGASSPDSPNRRRYPPTTAGGWARNLTLQYPIASDSEEDDKQSPTEVDEEQSPTDEDLVLVHDLDLTNLDIFSEDGRYRSPGYLSYIASLGLDFIHKLVFANELHRKDMIRMNMSIDRAFLPEALAVARATSPPTAMQAEIADDEPSHPNYGFRLFIPTNTNYCRYLGINPNSSLGEAPLREMAYAFWNSDRFACPATTAKLIKTARMPRDDLRRLFDRRTGMSAEERLKGVKLPRHQGRRIEEEFGCPRGWYEVWDDE